jgi:glycosyltransferase involved in cell wall biosynthesis
MKILHIVTLIDQERTYGGPVSVAVNLAEEQVRQGHQVTILSLAPTSSDKKKMYSNNGVDFVAFRASHLLFLNSFSSMFSFASVKWLFGTAKIYDVAHLHFSRDLFQVTSARIVNALKVPLFLQTHGMITNAEAKVKKIQRLYDAIFVKPAFQQAKQVLALQKVELAQLKSNFGISNVRLLANGVQMAATFPSDKAGSNLVAFVSRLHPRKNPLLMKRKKMKYRKKI